jgi:hypothetical protein
VFIDDGTETFGLPNLAAGAAATGAAPAVEAAPADIPSQPE